MTVESTSLNTPDEPVDVRALFLGPKAENRTFFEEAVREMIQEHIYWRRDFHPMDRPVLLASDKRDPSFIEVEDRTKEILEDLTSQLKATSTPWFSTRYLGHMNSDTLMISNLAEIATMLYNPNNVAYESSVATSQMEVEVGEDLALLMGYDPKHSWGHITTDGTVANYEALWIARNMKSFPHAIKHVLPHLVEGLDDWALSNVATSKILELLDVAKADKGVFTQVLDASTRGQGTGHGELGKVLVPSTRHYSWDKAVDLLGIGVSNLVLVPVDERFRMDLSALESIMDDLIEKKIPILAVVSVVGTTEEGAVDDVAGTRALLQKYRDQGVNCYYHIDAAYGGYARALFLDENHYFMDQKQLRGRLEAEGFEPGTTWPSSEVWHSFEAMNFADSITVDPHKMGYIPYSAGGIAIRDKRVLGLISYAAAYVFENPDNLDLSLGSVVLEGSKSGTTVAGVWGAHHLLPLTFSGYGQLIARSWQGAHTFAKILSTVEEVKVGTKKIRCYPLLVDPDFNIVCMAFNVDGNENLDRMNALNQELYHHFSYEYGPLYQDDWITSHTELAASTYKNAPREFVERMGIAKSEWDRVGSVTVLRSCVMHPWIALETTYPEQWETFLSIMTSELEGILDVEGANYVSAVNPS
jgi:tyrosine decarboxylase